MMSGHLKSVSVLCENEISENVASILMSAAEKKIKAGQNFIVGVAGLLIGMICFVIDNLYGGSVAKLLCKILPSLNSDWPKWKVFFVDERHVDHNDAESTYGFYKTHLCLPIDLIASDVLLSVEVAAKNYEKKLREITDCSEGVPSFDMLVLGMGPDGHIASLFPNHPILKVDDAVVTYVDDSPKPPPKRITLTLPAINNAKQVIIVATGSSKADAIKLLHEENCSLPVALVKASNLYLLLDADSASKIGK